ncbi:MAG TPA: acetyl-CoA C-acyltransferase [Lentisphaeria bacterium]|jgi:acetyl-CoA acetyltransferase family protein|nr:acetyl-CoA C-acyltransferase [Lentisphaeria bacterium]|tara:strand:- start:876 stop:2165 length:1290 start_codon:yes stop_codon:yes gene_type:complete
MKERIAIIDGIRTPMCKAGGVFKDIQADQLGAWIVTELIARSEIDPALIDELIMGNVGNPAHAMNIARVIALKAGLPQDLPAFTVHRNCGSGNEALTTAAAKIQAGDGDIYIVGGTESMSSMPLLYGPRMTELFANLAKSKTLSQKLGVISKFRPSFLKPVIGIVQGLTDPVCGLIMGKTAELLAREFHITREEQDRYAVESHKKAAAAIESGRLAEEILPIPVPPRYKAVQEADDSPRDNQSMDALGKLRPYFDRHNGTVTVGNSCPLTDAAAAMLVMGETKAKELGLTPIGFLRAYAYAGLEPHRMGLGPVYSTAKVLDRSGMTMSDIELVELNEAFAAQAIANLRAFDSDEFAARYFGRHHKIGAIDPDILNVNGGAIALGHPVGMTGARLVITTLKELHRRNCNVGLATMCIGGGQGGALLLEAA